MQAISKPQIPLTVLVMAIESFLPNPQAIATGSMASMEWCAFAAMPTQNYVLPSSDDSVPVPAEPALSMMALATTLLPNSRPMTDWEREDADDFFWSQFV